MKRLVASLLCLCLSLCTVAVATAQRQTTALPTSAASLTSDQLDYAPGSTATLTGAGFVPGEQVTLQVLHADGTSNGGADHQPWTVTADDGGGFVATWHVCEDDCVGATLQATAVGASGLTASVQFTDGANIDCSRPCSPSLRPGNIPTNGAAVVDGVMSPGEWNLATDLWTNMYIAGDGTKTLLSKAYARFVCNANGTVATVYLLVKAEPGQHITVDSPCGSDSWVKICETTPIAGVGGSQKVVDSCDPGAHTILGVPSSFKYGGLNGAGTEAQFYEASFALPAGTTWGLFPHAHVQSDAGGTLNTSAASAGSVCMTLTCPTCVPNPSFSGCNNETIELGCNPQTLPTCDNSVTATDGCGNALQVTCTPGSITNVGTCGRKQVFTYTAGGASCTTTYTWTEDTTAPVITLTAAGTITDCNPTEAQIEAAFGTATVTDDCSTGLTAVGVVGPEEGTDCNRTRTKTWTVTDACGNPGTVSQTVSYTVDSEPPVITAIGADLALGCNPTAEAIEAALGTATAEDNCGVGAPSVSTGAVVSDGCSRSQTRTWNVTDACGNVAAAVSRTATWTEDLEAPVISLTGEAGPVALGCNPKPEEIEAALGTATATDNCGPLAPTFTDGDVMFDGCSRSQTRTWNVSDACENAATPVSRTVTWTEDTEAPVITLTDASALGCNPTAEQIEAAFGGASVTDNCSAGLVATGSVGAESGSGCTYSTTKSWTVTDACGNTGTASQTVTYTRDTENPVITLAAASALGCNPTAAQIEAAFGEASVTDNCSAGLVATGSVGAETGSGCTYSTTKSWTVTDECGNTGTATQTVTYTRDTTPPVITCPADITVNGNGQCEVTVNLGSASVTDDCSSGLTATNDHPSTSFPIGTTAVTWTATDECGNTSTCTQNVTVKGRINVIKFFDANGNGQQDAGENGVPNVTFNLSGGGSVTTDANGNASFNVVPGTYTVSEVVPSGWTSTTPSQSVTIDATHCSVTVKFGDVFLCKPSNGLTLGFWSNKNGNAILTANSPGWVNLLNGLNCLRNADGSKHTFSTVADFNNWILNANATNMAYMLSAQLAANVLDKAYNGLGGNVFVPGGVQTLANVCIVPFLTTPQAIACGSPLLSSTTIAATCGSCSPTDALVTVNDLQARAVCLLEPSAAVHSTVAAGTQRTYEECVKDILDMINNNGNPSGASAYPCGGVKVPVTGGTCPPAVTPSSSGTPKPKGGSSF